MNLEPLKRYRDKHLSPGSFFRSILENDVRSACAYAGEEDRVHIFDYVKWCENELPQEAWGTQYRVEAWIAYGTNDKLRNHMREFTDDGRRHCP